MKMTVGVVPIGVFSWEFRVKTSLPASNCANSINYLILLKLAHQHPHRTTVHYGYAVYSGKHRSRTGRNSLFVKEPKGYGKNLLACCHHNETRMQVKVRNMVAWIFLLLCAEKAVVVVRGYGG
ncbi:hypothetical protein M8C21_002832 [Ambrosia artemisiifolia]|uniref:Uncharacterized protein n=1 Tax=Ambrosia artemisiifolia TaxID=4212 RepID=A0AAD5CZD9_AMBAR|nr:hypothetical protein M8C21_002832 [Ambrosia artemisiifolia]